MSPRRRASPRSKPSPGGAPIFAALGDEMRLRLIAVLCVGGAMSITQLTSERLWEFEPAQLDEARRSLEMIARQWDHALTKLKLAVEK
jgi:hypothetical protein